MQARVGRPQVAYKETITVSTKSEGRFVRQTGGRGQYGHCWLEIAPLDRGSGFEFVNKVVGGVIPREYIKPIEEGARGALESGGIQGYPVVDVRVTVIDGSYHDVDSSEMAFTTAASLAVKAGLPKCRPVLLEPVMKMEVSTPEDFLGDVLGSLNSRRAQITGVEPRGGLQIVSCFVPLAETFGYTTDLRSLTQGRASASMEFYRYEEVPAFIAAAVGVKAATR